MQYGFLIDHDRCIGCHACTTACKAENEVPVGSFRTWVKYTEQGVFPEVKRHFAVLRCNHCTDAPCVTICPVKALDKRADGIVDIDRDACIGCRACMQACPYDAIYLNEERGAVEKCHFCAHRVEKGLEPACAIVCPETAIIAGDLDDPNSNISRLLRANPTLVRRPEQQTGPNVHYKGVLADALHPGAAERPSTFIWSDRPRRKPETWPISLPIVEHTRTVLDTEHKVEWGWGVAAYLLTKGIAGGVMMLAPFAAWIGLDGFAMNYAPELIALLFIGITGLLLVEDLYKPFAFIRLFTRPNWNSWLVKGAWVINAFVAVTCIALGARLAGLEMVADLARWIALPIGAAVAGYTAFLFKQCKGRDLWEGPMVLPHLLVQAVLCGGAALAAWTGGVGSATFSWMLPGVIALAALAHMLFARHELRAEHHTDNARQAAAFLPVIRLGPFRAFRDGLLLIALGAILAFPLPMIAWLPILAGLFLYEHAFLRAGQLPPLS